MIRSQIKQLLDDCFTKGIDAGLWSNAGAGRYTIEQPKREGQGDFSTNFALVLAGIEKRKPRELAEQLGEMLRQHTGMIEKIDIAGPGFVNMFIAGNVWRQVVPDILRDSAGYGYSTVGAQRKVMVEFVSANPTGPLSIGHGRQAILGDAIARLLEVTGHDVYREYYYNDAGRQMRVLGQSTRARYLEKLGLPGDFPEDGYQGEYIQEISQSLIDDFGDSLKDEADIKPFKERAEQFIFADISNTLKKMDIRFDNYFNERSLYENGLIDDVVSELRSKGYVYEKDNAVWFKTSELGQEQDRVIIKSSGEPTYRLPDIAYHREKFRRNFDWLVDIFGSDHIATVPDVLAGVRALGYDPAKVTVVLHQFVTLTRDGKQVKMSTRKANFVTVDELIDLVGIDAVRFFFMMRKADSQLEFDLELATKESQENPVYYVQYAHARLCSILEQAKAKRIQVDAVTGESLQMLREPEELQLLRTLCAFPAAVENAALELAPHKMIYYLLDLAGQFHSYYNKHKVLIDDQMLSTARLNLVQALLVVVKNALAMIGLTAPDKM